MLLLSETLIDVPIMSLQTGAELARTVQLIIDPRNLSIYGFYAEGPHLDAHPSVLHVEDIREAGELGFIVNDSAALMPLEGLVRLQEVLDYKFELIGIMVYDKAGSKLGKAINFAYEPASYTIQQIHIHQSFLKSLSSVSNIVHRKQIISVTRERIVVDMATIKDRVVETADAARALVNPFRSVEPEPITRRR